MFNLDLGRQVSIDCNNYMSVCLCAYVYVYIYIYVCVFMCVCIYIYIYIYIERERERERYAMIMVIWTWAASYPCLRKNTPRDKGTLGSTSFPNIKSGAG